MEAVWRMESAKIIAKLARMLRNVGLAEELAQDALVSALEQWPRTGLPDNPGAWLMAAAKNRASHICRNGVGLVSVSHSLHSTSASVGATIRR